jgi:hypothetical protein
MHLELKQFDLAELLLCVSRFGDLDQWKLLAINAKLKLATSFDLSS